MGQLDPERSFKTELTQQFSILGGLLALFWVLEIGDQLIFQQLWRGGLDNFGVRPHALMGLWGILWGPFLHGDFAHLISNSVPFLILGWLVMLQDTRDFFIVTAITMAIGGLGIWLVGASGSVHIGASVLIFGYLGFLLFRGYFQKNLPSIALSLFVFFAYGGLVWGVLPSSPVISWEGHLFGFIGGIVAAKFIADKGTTSGSRS